MRTKSHIEWTDTTWNPVTGCTKISAGCKFCYAERMAKRLKAMHSPRYRDGFQVTLHHDLIDLPLSWRQPRMVFVNSMSDLFHPQVPLEFIQAVFQVLTKPRIHNRRSLRSWNHENPRYPLTPPLLMHAERQALV